MKVQSKQKQISFKQALMLLFAYAKVRIVEQIRSVAFIIIYLVVFQTLILGVPLANALGTAGGIAMVVAGLAFFLEGLILGLMPLGERVGVKLPTKVGIVIIAIFGLFLGFGATLAEPAISALRTAGSAVTAWSSPLLFMILERYTSMLVTFVGIGVAIAVALGMFRFYYNWSIKPFIFTIIPLVLLLSFYVFFDENMSQIIGLAWDCGAVTTGAVTVPLVLALGIGVSRAASKGKGSSGGFGIILLASAFPILSVLLLGLHLNTKAPQPSSESEFFALENRESAMNVFGTDDLLQRHAYSHAGEEGRRAFYGDEESYRQAIAELKDSPEKVAQCLGAIPLNDWLTNTASDFERAILADVDLSIIIATESEPLSLTLKEEAIGGVRAVIPLSIMLLLVLTLFLREKLRYKDEVALGILFTLIGMTLLTTGIRLGLASLGGEVGSQLPRAFASEEKFIDRMMINNFDTTVVFSTITAEGNKKQFFNLLENEKVSSVEFLPNRYDSESMRYEHVITQKPLFSNQLSYLGILLVLLFAFGMGYGATLAEPALNALGMTVETMTVGTMKRTKIVQVVSIGVGMGILLGMSRILFDIPLLYMLAPAYLILMPLTYFSAEEFTSIAWDSGGVTTGPVTVPLVLAMGLSIGSELNVTDGFGVLAMASACPIITVLTYGLMARAKQKRSMVINEEDQDNE